MKHLDVRFRLGATFILLVAVFFVVGWQGVWHLRQLDREMQEVISNPTAQALARSQAEFAAVRRRLVLLVIEGGLITAAIAVYVIDQVTGELGGRRGAEKVLRQLYDGAERRVQQRTAELGRSSESLEAEITAHMQAAEKLQQSQERLRAITDSAQDAIVMMDPGGLISFWNPAAERIFGHSRAEALGQNLNGLLAPLRFLPAQRAAFAAFQQTGQGAAVGKTLDLEARRKDGREISIQLSLSAAHTEGGWHAVGIIRDCTGSKKAQLEIQHQASFARFNPNPVLEFSATGEINYFNGATEAMVRELGRENPAQMLPPDTGAMVRECLSSGTPKLGVETQIGLRVISWSFFPVQLTNTVHCYGSEVTARKQDEEALRWQNAALDAAANAIVITDPSGNILRVNAAFTALTGYSAQEVLGKNLRLLKSGKQDEGFYRNLWQTISSGQVWRGELTNRRKDGSLYVEEMTITPVRSADGTIVRHIAIKQDICERKRGEEALRASQQIIEGIINAIPVRVFWKDKNLVYLGCNSVFARDAGFVEPKDLIGKDDYQMAWRDQADKYRGDDRQVIESGCSKLLIEEPQTTPEGNTITLLSSKIPLRSSNGEISGVIGMYMDITERKRAEQELQERAKLAKLEADVGKALTQGRRLAEMLRLCGEAIVRQLDVAFARIWTLNEREQMLELQASAGLYTHLNGPHGRVPVGQFKIGLIAQERKPHLTNQVVGDPRIGDQEWAKREGMVAFAGYPLLVEDRLVGVCAMFARHILPDTILQALASISNNIAVGIERHRSAEALRVSQRKFQDLFESSRDALLILESPGWRFTSANPACLNMFGAENEAQLFSKGPWELSPERQMDGRDSADKAREIIETALRDGSHFFEWTHRRFSGEEFPADVLLTRMEQGGKTYLQGTVRDITARKQAEATRDRLIAILEATPDMVGIADPSGHCRYFNRAGRILLGIGPEEDMSSALISDFHAADDAVSPKGISTAIQEGVWTGDSVLLSRDGRKIPISQVILAHKTPDGKLEYLSTVMRDMTEQKRAEEKLKLFRTLVDRSIDGIHVLDPATGGFLDANESACQALGYSRDELLALTLFDVMVGIDHAAFEARNAKLEKAGHATPEALHRRKDGTTYPVEAALSFVTLDRKYLVAVVRDITARKKTEAEMENIHKQLMESSRLAGMAEVATNVLHNVGNALNSVNISADLATDGVKKFRISSLARIAGLLQEHADDLGEFITHDPNGRHVPAHLARLSEHLAAEQEKIAGELDSLRRNVEHIKDIVAMQQKYAMVGGMKEMTDLAGLVEDSVRLNEGALSRHGVEIVRELDKVPAVNVEKHKILQILVNLVRNAKYACDESGRAGRRLTVRVAKSDGRVRISVIDNGIGIPPENLTRIFNHGFTTRRGGHGFGLHGSALAAKEMGGSLTVESGGTGQGAAFTLELPCATQEEAHE